MPELPAANPNHAAVSRYAAGFFAPSGALPDPSVMDRASAYLSEQGWAVRVSDSVLARDRRFAGPDALRAADLHRCACDPGLDLAIAAHGGYGLSRLLGRLDYAAIAAVGRPIVGYSDFTAFNLALLARAGAISFQGPAAADFGPGVDRAYTMTHFFGALQSPAFTIEFQAQTVAAAAHKEVALDLRGRLWGGNLAMVCSMLGTAYFPRVRGGILFLEDVNEPLYRIERMLLQLAYAGVLARQRAVLLGDFAPVLASARDHGYTMADVLNTLLGPTIPPLISGLPFGHGPRRVTLPVGAHARLQVRAGRARLEFRGHPLVGGPRRGCR